MSFFKPTIDSIISDITNKIEQLHAVAAFHAEASSFHARVIEDAQEARAFAVREFDRAKALAEKFTALVTP